MQTQNFEQTISLQKAAAPELELILEIEEDNDDEPIMRTSATRDCIPRWGGLYNSAFGYPNDVVC